MVLKNITKKYGDNIVFENFNLDIEEGKITCILGKSGSGKTTLLNIIAKLTNFEGEIIENGENISFIFQNQRLINNLTVWKNLEYVLKFLPKEERNIKISNILKKVKLYDNKDMYPRQLSGGMAQRVSLARAFVYPSNIILMDEPFKGMDISLKKHIVQTFQELYLADKKTAIFVTHDIEEALILGDRIIILGDGGSILFDKKLLKRDDSTIDKLRKDIYNII